MKVFLLIFCLIFHLSPLLQAQSDTLKPIVIRPVGWGENESYLYSDKLIRRPLRLAPYLEASGDTAVIRLLGEFQRKRLDSEPLNFLGIVIYSVGGIIMITGFANGLRNFGSSSKGNGPGNAIIGGCAMIVGGGVMSLIARAQRRKAYKILNKSIHRYNQGRATPVSLEVGASSNGASMFIRF